MPSIPAADQRPRFGGLVSDGGIRFAAWSGAERALVGTTNEAHLAEVVAAAAKGPLPESTLIRERFERLGSGWEGLI